LSLAAESMSSGTAPGRAAGPRVLLLDVVGIGPSLVSLGRLDVHDGVKSRARRIGDDGTVPNTQAASGDPYQPG
jgi:hypothetical protein